MDESYLKWRDLWNGTYPIYEAYPIYEHHPISYKFDKSSILKMLYSLLADQGELDYEANLALAVLNGDRVAARALADKIVEEIGV